VEQEHSVIGVKLDDLIAYVVDILLNEEKKCRQKVIQVTIDIKQNM